MHTSPSDPFREAKKTYRVSIGGYDFEEKKEPIYNKSISPKIRCYNVVEKFINPKIILTRSHIDKGICTIINPRSQISKEWIMGSEQDPNCYSIDSTGMIGIALCGPILIFDLKKNVENEQISMKIEIICNIYKYDENTNMYIYDCDKKFVVKLIKDVDDDRFIIQCNDDEAVLRQLGFGSYKIIGENEGTYMIKIPEKIEYENFKQINFCINDKNTFINLPNDSPTKYKSHLSKIIIDTKVSIINIL